MANGMPNAGAHVSVSRIDAVAVITFGAPPVNALSADLRRHLQASLLQADADAAVDAIILIGAGRNFSAGADITEFGRPPAEPSLRDLIDAIDSARKPVVAALQGAALGGGLELALACHARVADASARVGLPEVKLGLLPGAGGTQRLPRLVGPTVALEMIALGSPLDAAAALAAGLVDEIVEGASLHDGAVAHARRLVGRPLRRVRDRDDKIADVRRDDPIFARFRQTHARRFKGLDAPAKCIAAVEIAVDQPFETGLAAERRMFLELLEGGQSAALRHVFFAERRAARGPDDLKGAEPVPIARVGIVGAGTMGTGIAMSIVAAGLPVTIVEQSAEALARGLASIRASYDASAKKGRISAAEVAARMGLIEGAVDLTALAGCDLIIEAVFELLDVKRRVFAALDAIVKPGAILASNTSYLDIDAIAAATARPDRVLGLHFFSPAHVMRLLEVVRGAQTDAAVVATVLRLARTLGKAAVVVRTAHGFVGNRMLAVRQREATRLVVEGAMPWDVDRVLVDFGMPMGPFAMADLAGLDLGWRRETSSGATLRDMLCEADRRGQKNRRGFYDYDDARVATPSDEVADMIKAFAARQGVARRLPSDADILEGCLYPMINEGAQILDEGIAACASDIDVVWVNGYGWPAYRGGPMFYADEVGLKHISDWMTEFCRKRGNEGAPAPFLQRLVRQGRRFRDG